MEKIANEKAAQYIATFKQQLAAKCAIAQHHPDSLADLAEFIASYEPLIFTRDEMNRKKRPKNFVPIYDRCCAKRSSEEQCTRRRKVGSEYCGTHCKGTPHGVVNAATNAESAAAVSVPSLAATGPTSDLRVDVWAQDIMGIVYYVDKRGNVYDTEDVLSNKMNPKIIAKYEIRNDQYVIPEFR